MKFSFDDDDGDDDEDNVVVVVVVVVVGVGVMAVVFASNSGSIVASEAELTTAFASVDTIAQNRRKLESSAPRSCASGFEKSEEKGRRRFVRATGEIRIS